MPKLNEKGAPVLYSAEGCAGSSSQKEKIVLSMRGSLVADDDEFAHFEECMNASLHPSEAIVAGAKLLSKYPRRR